MNVLQYGLSSRVQLVQGQWFAPLAGTFDGIVANPPYIPSAHVDDLPPDVRQEPRVSLDGGTDGASAIRHLMDQAPQRLTSGGVLALECGEDHVRRWLQAVRAAPWSEQACPIHDLAGRPRGILVTHV